MSTPTTARATSTPDAVRATLDRRAGPTLPAAATLTIAGLFGALLTARPELAALAAPFAVLLVAGIVLAERPDLDITLTVADERIVEGDSTSINVVMASSVPLSRVACRLDRSGRAVAIDPADGRLAWAGPIRHGTRTFTAVVQASRWGIERFGPLTIVADGPLGIVRWRAQVAVAVTVRVLPSDATLRTLLPPPEPRTASGVHVSRRRGDGLEFAEVRPYRPGDRLRSVNWHQSGRRGELWVNEHHPERTADLIVLLDTFADRLEGGSDALEPAVRIAWQLALAHLAVHDRVGIVGFGGLPAWLTPNAGSRARLVVMDRLLAAEAHWADAPRRVSVLPARLLPAGAHVVAVTGLHDERMVTALGDLLRRGHDVSAVVIAAPTPATVDDDDAVRLARRLWALQRRERRRTLERAGLPIVVWSDGDPATAALALSRTKRFPIRRAR